LTVAENHKKPASETTDSTQQSSFSQSMAEAARRAGFGAAADGSPMSAHTILAAMGGIRGIIEAILPGFLFLTIYAVTRDLVISLAAPVVIGVVFMVIRIAQRQPLIQALGGLAGIAFSAGLALLSGQPEHYYLPGFITNAVYGLVLLISVLIRWPLIGLAVGFLMGDGVAWRKDPLKRRVLSILTLIWVGMFALRLVVQLPLYFMGDVTALGTARLIMGVPLYAPVLILSWLMIRPLYHVPHTDAGSQGPQ
jgi:intracellular septation protein A